MPIKILPETVTNKIAAGEVVENPASVVKELVENAIDAQARSITVRIQGAGKELIEVSDDGVGIPAGELELAITRFATSKINEIDDLMCIRSLGFRGEALASIASVSYLRVHTRAKWEKEGSELLCEGGKVKSITPKAFPQGSSFEVRDLFLNVPARLKFLKADRTERSRIARLLMFYALAYPEIRFVLEMEGRTTLQTAGNGNKREILAGIYDLDIARQMLEVEFLELDVHIHGFTSPVGVTRSNRREINFFVNGRLVKDIGLTSALVNAYHSYIMVGRYPIAAIFIDIKPQNVDINIHPAKAEVRFQDARAITGKVVRAIRLALLASNPAPTITRTMWSSPEVHTPAIQINSVEQGIPASQTQSEIQPVDAPKMEKDSQPELKGYIPLLRVIGQVGGTYIVAEGPDGLYLIDQHAAHERVLYEQLLDRTTADTDSQLLLEPITFSPNAQELEMLESILGPLRVMGFEIEPFGPGTYSIRAVPAFMKHIATLQILKDALHELEEEGRSAILKEKEEILVRSICKGMAVKGSTTLSIEEQKALVRQLEACQNPRTCPHGRPTMIHLTIDILEKQFGRKGSL